MRSVINSQNFNGIIDSLKDFAISVKQFVEINSKEFINFLGRNVTCLKNEHPKASKAALIAGTVFVAGIVVVVVVVSKKIYAKKGALSVPAKKITDAANVNLPNKKSEDPNKKAEELAAAKLSTEQAEQAKQAAEDLKTAAEAKQAEEEKKAIINEQKKVANQKLEQTHILLVQVQAEYCVQKPIYEAKSQAFVDYQIEHQEFPLHLFFNVNFSIYTREDAIAFYTNKKFLDSVGKGVDVAMILTYLNLKFDSLEEANKVTAIHSKALNLLKNKAELIKFINSN